VLASNSGVSLDSNLVGCVSALGRFVVVVENERHVDRFNNTINKSKSIIICRVSERCCKAAAAARLDGSKPSNQSEFEVGLIFTYVYLFIVK
jgi:hypothetical protein